MVNTDSRHFKVDVGVMGQVVDGKWEIMRGSKYGHANRKTMANGRDGHGKAWNSGGCVISGRTAVAS